MLQMQEEWMNAVTEVMDELRKALSELEDCRARNADMRTMLEQVTRERDEARAEVGRLRTEVASSLAMASAEADVLRGFGCMEDGDGPCGVCRECFYRHGYRRGAEAMRKRCAMWVKHNSHEDGLGMGSQRMESALSALPIPEEP